MHQLQGIGGIISITSAARTQHCFHYQILQPRFIFTHIIDNPNPLRSCWKCSLFWPTFVSVGNWVKSKLITASHLRRLSFDKVGAWWMRLAAALSSIHHHLLWSYLSGLLVLMLSCVSNSRIEIILSSCHRNN